MKTHELKTDAEVFHAVWLGIKHYEIRFDDRGFRVGDEILLFETASTGEDMKNGAPLKYTGRRIRVIVTHKIKRQYGLKEGWCVLGVELKTRVDDALNLSKWNGFDWGLTP